MMVVLLSLHVLFFLLLMVPSSKGECDNQRRLSGEKRGAEDNDRTTDDDGGWIRFLVVMCELLARSEAKRVSVALCVRAICEKS
jgi:hypothetical protein